MPSTFDRTCVAHTTLILTPPLVNGCAHPFPMPPGTADPTAQQQDPPTRLKISTRRLDTIRESLGNKGLSNESSEIVCASWTAGTDKQYKGVWEEWRTDRFTSTICNNENYNEGKRYSTINIYRSAISTTFACFSTDKRTFGSHKLFSRSLKGMFLWRSPTPRYSSTWDISKVTNYLMSLGPTKI